MFLLSSLRLAYKRAFRCPNLLQDAAKLLGPSPILFDVGANVGQTTEAMLATFQNPRVYAFEPSPYTFEEMEGRIGDRAVLINAGVGAEPGALPFYRHHDSSSILDSFLPMVGSSEPNGTARVVTIVDFCREKGIEHIDFLKIDTQGFELNALRGAVGMLPRTKLIAFEVTTIPQYEGQPKPSELFAFAEQHEFRIVRVYPGFDWKGDPADYFDVLMTH